MKTEGYNIISGTTEISHHLVLEQKLKPEQKQNDILTRLTKLFREYSRSRRVDPDSQMYEFWQDPTIEILVGSDELNALEIEFDIEINRDDAIELYDMNLKEAAEFIETMIVEQNSTGHSSDSILDELTLDEARNILKEIWNERSSGKALILNTIERIEYKNRMKNKETK
jgi:hypothetical protein